MLETLSTKTLEAIFDALPVEITFVDAEDLIRYYNDHKMFGREPSIIGTKVQDCHPQKSLDKVNQVVSDLKAGRRDVAEFWMDLKGRKIYIRYSAVRDKTGKYIGILEVIQDITDFQKIKGGKRLLDEG